MKLHSLPFPQIFNQCDALFLQGFIFMYQYPLCFHRWAKPYICLTVLFWTYSEKCLIKRKGNIQHLEVNLICRSIIEYPSKLVSSEFTVEDLSSSALLLRRLNLPLLGTTQQMKKYDLELLSLCKNCIPLSLLSGCFICNGLCFIPTTSDCNCKFNKELSS